MKFSRQEYWSRLLFPTQGDLPDPGIQPVSPALAGSFFTTVQPGKPVLNHRILCLSAFRAHHLRFQWQPFLCRGSMVIPTVSYLGNGSRGFLGLRKGCGTRCLTRNTFTSEALGWGLYVRGEGRGLSTEGSSHLLP